MTPGADARADTVMGMGTREQMAKSPVAQSEVRAPRARHAAIVRPAIVKPKALTVSTLARWLANRSSGLDRLDNVGEVGEHELF